MLSTESMIEIKSIPGHWKLENLGSICKTTSGGTPSRKVPDYYKGNIPWVKSGELDNGLILDTEEKITESAVKNSSAKLFPKGTLLIALYGATIGKISFLGVNAATNQAVCGIFESPKLNHKYLFYYLSFSKPTLVQQGIGGAQPNISQGILKNLKVPVPPRAEQEQIVEKIEELFSELDAGKRLLETVKEQLKTYRQAVLKNAFDGRLTNDSIKDGEMPKDWNWIMLENVCSKIQDGSHFSPKIQYDGPGLDRFKYITAKNIRNNYLDLSNLTYVDRQFHSSIFPRCNPEYGDILMTKDGVNTGEVTANTLNEEFSLLSSVCLFKPNKELLNSSYLKYFIQSPFGSKIIDESMTGTAIKRIILKKLRTAKIVLPPLDEQERIVSEIDSRLSVCNKIEDTICNCLQQSEVLKQGILQQAFKGNLVMPK